MITNRDMSNRRPPELADPRTAIGIAIGAFGCLFLAAVLVPLRDDIPNADMALALVVPVLLAGTYGGRAAGVTSAVVAALTFNFFFTQPYLSLRIASSDDIVTFLMLLTVALIAAEAGVRARRGGAAARESKSEVQRLGRVAELSTAGAGVSDVIEAVQTEMRELLALEDCVWEPDGKGALPRLGRRGALEDAELVAWGELVLPTGGVEVPVRGRGRQFGRLVLYARPATPASLEKRLVAVVLADELGLTLAAT
jgi:K+-sensing histidine kinase KdpD